MKVAGPADGTDPSVPAETYPEDTPVVPETTPGQTKPPCEEIP